MDACGNFFIKNIVDDKIVELETKTIKIKYE